VRAMSTPKVLWVLGLLAWSTAAQANAFVKNIDLAPHARPESITKAWGGKYYVSIQGPASDTTTVDGAIVQVDLATGAVTPFVAAGHSLVNPRGLAFTGEFLVVTDTQNVWKVDHEGHVSLAAQPTAYPQPPIFFNDAAVERGGKAVFVSEMGAGRAVQRDPASLLWPADSAQAEAIPTGARVYRISIKDGTVTNAFSPTRKILVTNGITEAKAATGDDRGSGDKHLLVLDFFHGSVVDVDLKKDSKRILATGPFRGCDGIEQAKDGTIFVTSFENGRVWRMDKNGENLKKLFDLATDQQTTARQTLADLALDEAAGLLYVPDTLHNRITVVGVDLPKN
jgi:sugar lactone lactonase YvrE